MSIRETDLNCHEQYRIIWSIRFIRAIIRMNINIHERGLSGLSGLSGLLPDYRAASYS